MKKIALTFILVLPVFSTQSWAQETEDPFAMEREKIKAAISAKKSEMRGCYNRLTEKKKIGEGKMVVELEINDQGQLTKTEMNEKKSKLKDADLFACMKEIFSKTYFPQSPKGKVLSVSYPFTFQKVK